METPEVLFLALVAGLAVWRRSLLLYAGGFVAFLVYGVQVAETDLALGMVMALVGVYLLVQGIESLWK